MAIPNPMQDIQDAVVAYILNKGVPLITQSNLFVRDVPEIKDGDPSPCLIITMIDDRPSIYGGEKTNTTYCFDYPVYILLARKVAGTPVSDPWKKEARYCVRKALNRSWLLGGDGIVRRC